MTDPLLVLDSAGNYVAQTPEQKTQYELDAAAQASAPPPVPAFVTNAQMRVALRISGLLIGVKDFVTADKAAHNAINPKDDGELWERWEYGNQFGRHDSFILTAQAQFGKTDADMDALFVLAGKQ